MQKQHRQSHLHQIIISGFVALVLSLALIAGSLLIKRSQDLRQRAAVGTFDSETGTDQPCQGSGCGQTAGVYVSPNQIYRITYDPQLWHQAMLPSSASKSDREQAYFVQRSPIAFASMYLSASPKDAVAANATIGRPTGTVSVEEVATVLEKQIKTKLGRSKTQPYTEYLGYTIKTDAYAAPVIQFRFQYHNFNQVSPYDEYVFVGDRFLLEVEARWVATAGAQSNIDAFLRSISFVDPAKQSSQVKGASTVAATYTSSELAELVKPSVVQVLHLYCKVITVNANRSGYALKSSYPFCNGNTGSGFVVNEAGYVATNGHVVSSFPEQDIIAGLLTGDRAVYTFLSDLLQEVSYEQGKPIDSEQSAALLQNILRDPTASNAIVMAIYELLEKNAISVTPKQDLIYVSAANQPFDLQHVAEISADTIASIIPTSDSIVTANLVDMNFGNMYKRSVLMNGESPNGSDVALVKLQTDKTYQFPAVPVFSADAVKEGDPVIVIGYPGIVSGMEKSSLLDYSASAGKATVTQGIISAKKVDKSGNTLLQVDASIEHGNSGGPALNLAGDVIGIATYGLQSNNGNYNFLRDAKDLATLSSNAQVNLDQNGATYTAWLDGLSYFWQKRYTKSLQQFAKVESNYPLHPSVASYTDQAQQKIAAGEDVDLLFGLPKMMVFAGAGAIGLLVVIVPLVVFFMKRQRSAGSGPNQPSGGVTSQATATTQTPVAMVPSTGQPVSPSVQPSVQPTALPTLQPLPQQGGQATDPSVPQAAPQPTTAQAVLPPEGPVPVLQAQPAAGSQSQP